jgi:LPXTG-motif cell wall-anchored protein
VRRMERTTALRSLVAAGILALTLTLFGGMASAQDYGTQPPPSQGPTTTANQPRAAGTSVNRNDPLPVTGSDMVGLGVIGGGLVLVGGGALLARRRTA